MKSSHTNFDGINQAALRDARFLLPTLIPGGAFRGFEYVVRNPTRIDKTPGSFSINCKSGIWRDFATQEGGSDLISLVAYLQGTSQGEAAHKLADVLAVAHPKQYQLPQRNGAYTSQRERGADGSDAPKIYEGGDNGPRRFAREVRRHVYLDDKGVAVRIKVKFSSGKYANIYRIARDDVSIGWQQRKPSEYRAVPYVSRSINPFDPELSGDLVFWPEGERDVDTLDRANLPAFTFGGVGDGLTEDVKQVIADRRLASDRHVVILADNDPAGRIHANKKAALAHSVGAASIRVIPFAELPEKGDVSDYFAAGGTAESLSALVRGTEQWSPDDIQTRELPSATIEGANSDAGRPWPQLDEAALHGLAGDVVRALNPHTEADPVGILVQFLTTFGNIIGNNAYYQIESDRHHANLFSVHVGASAKGRKGTAGGRVRAVTRLADETWSDERTASGLSSGEGLINAVRDKVEKFDAKAQQFETVDPGIIDKRLMIVEPEFAGALSAMERHGNTLSPVIRNAWDGQRLQTLTKASPLKATGAHISIVAHITEEEARARLTRTEMANGLANRFLFCCVRRSKLLPHGGALPDAVLVDLAKRAKAAADFGRQVGRVGMTADAAAAWAAAYSELSAERPGLVGAIIARGEPQVIRLALIFALLDRKDTVAPRHLEAAMAVWAYCEASALRIFGDSLGDPIVDDILRTLRRRGPDGMTRTEISNLFGRHRTSDQIGAALQLLRTKNRVRSESRGTSGRPSEVWVAVGGAS
jgi:hypothetical protein